MKVQATMGAAALAVVLLTVPAGKAWHKPSEAGPPDFDVRRAGAAAPAAPAALGGPARRAAVDKLRERLPRAMVDFDDVLGAPRLVRATDGFLTGPGGRGRGLDAVSLAAVPAQDRHRVIKAFVQEHRAVFGHGAEALERARLKREYATAHNGMRTVAWEQVVDDIPVYESVFLAHLTKDEELICLASQFLPDPELAASALTPRDGPRDRPGLSAREAVLAAARALGEPVAPAELSVLGPPSEGARQRQQFQAPRFTEAVDARLVWLPLDGATLRLCWQVELAVQRRGERYRVLVDAHTGDVRLRRRLTVYVGTATYRVFTHDSPTPLSPGHATPLTNQPPSRSRTLLTWAALDLTASPKGWIDDGVNETRGNNCVAHLDRDANNQPDLPRPQGSPPRVFDFPLDLSRHPTNYGPAAVVQLFYWCNWAHDQLYALGFTEAAGNFQTTNFGRGGFGQDAVIAEAQDGAGFNNANFTPAPDGVPPRLQMFLFNGPSPWRDGSLDAEIILHEYTHGLTDRLVGGGVGLSALQSAGLAEGWSDFYALALLSQPEDEAGGTYAFGAYATYLYQGLTANYYYGIRRYPYSTDLAKNPLTFKDIDPGQAQPHAGVPLSPLFSPFDAASAAEVHNQGEVWCAMLWEVRANLLAKHGPAAGNELTLRLVTDGLKLSPPNPTFVQARDAILQADRVNHGGANQREIWRGFAKRGLGFSAVAPASHTTAGVVEAFDLPDDLRIAPAEGFTARGEVGGPFVGGPVTYALTNVGTNALAWSAANTSAWLKVAPSSGVLVPGGPPTNVIVSLSGAAGQLPAGIYTATVTFTNWASGQSQCRAFTLRVGQPDSFTELFTADNDLAYTRFTFTPDGSRSFYTVCRAPANALPTDPAEGQALTLQDDTFAQVTLVGGAEVALYGRRTNVFFVGANGYLTLDEGDIEYAESFGAHFRLPRISALFDDLNPAAGGAVSWKQLSNRVAVTYLDVPEYGSATRQNTFQIEWFFDGRIQLTYLQVGSADGLVGLSAGQGLPAGFEASDFGAYPVCPQPLWLSLPATAIEGQAALAGQGWVGLPGPLPEPRLVSLSSSHPKKVVVPANVWLPVGQTNVVFDLAFPDDDELDGPQVVTITALITNFGLGQASITVFDNEQGQLSLSLPSHVREGDGAASGWVHLSPTPLGRVAVTLTSSEPARIQVPPEVWLSAGQTSAAFTLTVTDDAVINGSQVVVLTAHVPGWSDAQGATIVLDNESLALTLTAPATVREGDGRLEGGGRVALAGTLVTNLTVALTSTDPAALSVPSAVVIPAGHAEAVFDLHVGDNETLDGPRQVILNASAPGFETAMAVVAAADNEVPRVPAQPTPPDGATEVLARTNLTWEGDGPPVSYEVFFGTHPDLGPANRLGVTTNRAWDLPLLAPATTYYWQVVAQGAVATAGPVWQFTTRGVDHFDWSPVASPQMAGKPFAVTVTARDAFGTTVSNFTGTVRLRGFRRGGQPAPTVVITEVQPNDPDSVEFMNVSTEPLDLSGWRISAYDAVSWPAPRLTFPLPPGTVVPPAGLFLLMENGAPPGVFPTFYAGVNLVWNPEQPALNPTAVLLQNAEGQVVDFVCAADAVPASITVPVAIPLEQWPDNPLAVAPLGQSYQRTGEQDTHRASDWQAGDPSPGALNAGLIVPFAPGAWPVGVTPEESASFSHGQWTGFITVLEPGRETLLEARDAAGRARVSALFEVWAEPVVRLEVVGRAVLLSWPAEPGAAYRVEWKPSVTHAQWAPLGEDIQATGPRAQATDALVPEAQRFYRVVRLP